MYPLSYITKEILVHDKHTVDVLPLSDGFTVCKFQLQLFSHYLLQRVSSRLTTEKT